MRLIVCLALCCMALAGPARPGEQPQAAGQDGPERSQAGRPRAGKTGGTELERLVRFATPAGWKREPFQPEHLILLSNGTRRTIRIFLFGGEGSRHKDIAAFMDSLESKGEGDPPRERAGRAAVSGLTVELYRRRYRFELYDRHHGGGTPGLYDYIEDEFCVLPAGRRFVVLRYGTSSLGAPRPGGDPGRGAWLKFLKTVRLSPDRGRHDP